MGGRGGMMDGVAVVAVVEVVEGPEQVTTKLGRAGVFATVIE